MIYMKKVFAGLAIVTAMAACNSNAKKEAEIQQAKQYTIDSMNTAAQQEASASHSLNGTTRHYSSGTRQTTSGSNRTVYRSYSEPATLPTASAPAKKGWSNKAKGAVVGGVVGAVTGAAVSKDKKGKGAIIGGVVGAAGGYGVGAILDKKKKNQ
jgi:hypothetical protein